MMFFCYVAYKTISVLDFHLDKHAINLYVSCLTCYQGLRTLSSYLLGLYFAEKCEMYVKTSIFWKVSSLGRNLVKMTLSMDKSFK
jgi:hypothetical protein